MTGVLTGEDAYLTIGTTGTHTIYSVSDMTLNISRDIVEQELIGSAGNEFTYGALDIDGTFSCCKFGASSNHDMLTSIITAAKVAISGGVNAGSSELRFYFKSAQITGYDVTIGDANTITEASIDWTLLQPYDVTYTTGLIKDH